LFIYSRFVISACLISSCFY